MAELGDLRTLVEEIRNELREKATTEKINELIAKIDEKDATISTLTTRVDELESRLAIVEKSNLLLERKCDDLESYTRRQNLRIIGIPEPDDGSETAAVCVQKVKDEIAKLDLHLNLETAIDRAHRVGPKKDKQGKRIQRAMIVRFTSWRARTHVYTNRKKVANLGTAFYVDLTKRRVNLKMKAIEKITGNNKVNFAYADINNNICIMLSDGSKKFFNSEEELDTILNSL